MRLANARRRLTVQSGFTLVELLVVIGIIALLIAILLPALSRARESANLLKCMATLRSMGQAAHLHAAEHQGFMPLAGAQATYPMAAGVNDALEKKYTYYFDESTTDARTNNVAADAPAPLSAALGKYMNLSVDLTSRKKLQASLLQEAVYRAFTCPNDPNRTTTTSTLNYSYSGSRWGPTEVFSYLFNGAVLSMGHDGTNLSRAPAGKLSRVRHPAEVFLFCDGKPGQDPMAGYEVYCFADDAESGTLFDYWNRGGKGPDRGTFDYTRHRKRMNVAFVDGHVETLNLPTNGVPSVVDATKGDIVRVGVSKGIYQ